MNNTKTILGVLISLLLIFAIFYYGSNQNQTGSVDNNQNSMEQNEQQRLFDTTWKWVEFQDTADENSFTVDNPEQYTLEMTEQDSAYFMQADCNTVRGTFTLDGNSLTFGPGASTLMACAGESLDAQYMQFISNVASYVFDGENLVLNLKFDSGNLVFTK